MIYQGGDIDSITTENIESVESLPTGETLITFRVHGAEGTRTYIFQNHINEIAEAVEGIAEFL